MHGWLHSEHIFSPGILSRLTRVNQKSFPSRNVSALAEKYVLKKLIFIAKIPKIPEN